MPQDVSPTFKAQWDQKGAVLIDLSLSFNFGTAAEWRSIVESVGMPIRETTATSPETPTWDARVVALPPEVTLEKMYLRLTSHPHTGEGERAHWTFRFQRPPAEPPPPEVVAESENVGGYEGLLGRIKAAWVSDELVEAEVSGTFLINSRMWKVPTTPGMASRKDAVPTSNPAIQLLLRKVKVDWEVAPALPVLQRFSISTNVRRRSGTRTPRLTLVNGKGRVSFSPKGDILSVGERALWDDITVLLQRKAPLSEQRDT